MSPLKDRRGMVEWRQFDDAAAAVGRVLASERPPVEIYWSQ
jgi:hypothetical protein